MTRFECPECKEDTFHIDIERNKFYDIQPHTIYFVCSGCYHAWTAKEFVAFIKSMEVAEP